MKKITGYILALALVIALLLIPGCGAGADDAAAKTTTVSETTAITTAASESESNSVKDEADPETDDIDETGETSEDETIPPIEDQIPEDGEYTTLEQVSTYIHLYGHLPGNYLTKDEAKKLGWDAGKGNLWDVAPGAAIGGDSFGNYEGNLPDKRGRKYYECDVNYEGGRRGAERVVYSNDGLVYYTSDHYETFILFFGEE